MAPDLNSLPPSGPGSASSSPSHTRRQSSSAETNNNNSNNHSNGNSNGNVARSISPRSSSISLQATATMNAAADSSRRSSAGVIRGSPQARISERRRSGNYSVNNHENSHFDPTNSESPRSHHNRSLSSIFQVHSPPSIGGNSVIATGDPHHQRAPSFGELHQELEQEQEAQVNRLLLMIRNLQAQLNQLQQNPQSSTAASGTAIDDSASGSEGVTSVPTALPPALPPAPPSHRSPTPATCLLARRGSSSLAPLTPIHPTGSDAEASINTGGNDPLPFGNTDSRQSSSETYYSIERANLTRDNHLLRMRIRELERQIAGHSSGGPRRPSQPTPQSSEDTPSDDTQQSTNGRVVDTGLAEQDTQRPSESDQQPPANRHETS